MFRFRTSALVTFVSRLVCLTMVCLALLPLSARSTVADRPDVQAICSANKASQPQHDDGAGGSHAHSQHCDLCWQPLGPGGVPAQAKLQTQAPMLRATLPTLAAAFLNRPWSRAIARAPPVYS